MFHRILFLFAIGVTLFVLTATAETSHAQVVYGGRTYVKVPTGAVFYYNRSRASNRYYRGRPYSQYPYYTTYVQRPYYPAYGTHYYPYPSYYYAPYTVRYGNQWNYHRR